MDKTETFSSVENFFEMARRIWSSHADLNAVDMQDSTLEGRNTLEEGLRSKIFSGIV